MTTSSGPGPTETRGSIEETLDEQERAITRIVRWQVIRTALNLERKRLEVQEMDRLGRFRCGGRLKRWPRARLASDSLICGRTRRRLADAEPPPQSAHQEGLRRWPKVQCVVRYGTRLLASGLPRPVTKS